VPMAHTGSALARHRDAAGQGGAEGEGEGIKAAGEAVKPAGGEAEEEDFHSLVGGLCGSVCVKLVVVVVVGGSSGRGNAALGWGSGQQRSLMHGVRPACLCLLRSLVASATHGYLQHP
jgi:hypothetical protein